MDAERIRIIRLHKWWWADGYTLLWQLFILLFSGGIYFGLEQFGIGAAERTAILVLLVALILAATIWQATGLGIARVHMLLNGLELDSGKNPARSGPSASVIGCP
jgi:hypothetical protein